MRYYRIRAFIEGEAEEDFCLGENVEDALESYSGLPEKEPARTSLMENISIAMVHRVSFGEKGPLFEDVTHCIPKGWARASFHDAMAFYVSEQGGIE